MKRLIKDKIDCKKFKKARIFEEKMLSSSNQMYDCSVYLWIKLCFQPIRRIDVTFFNQMLL